MPGLPIPRLRLRRIQHLLMTENQRRNNIVLALAIRDRRRRERKERQYWVRPWIGRRRLLGQYNTLFEELERESQGDIQALIRMNPHMFTELLLRVSPRITKGPRSRRPLEPGLKLVITLRFLVTGASYRSLEFNFRVAHNTISLFVPEVCRAIKEEYQGELFVVPTTPDGWRALAEQFGTRWNFQHACGAIDGKHVAIRKPNKSGSLYYNYKGFFSIMLLAVVDAQYKFMWCSVGANGSASDAGIFNSSPLKPALENGTLEFPPPEPLQGDDRDIPYFMIGDDAFPLRKWLMKPYSQRGLTHQQRIFNYRLSRARRVVENAFGILAHRWRCLLTTLQVEPDNASTIVTGAIALHNLLRTRFPGMPLDVDKEDDDGNVIPGAWRDDVQLTDPQIIGGMRVTREGKLQRNYLCDYYNSPAGSVTWQEMMV